jgi:hypothetical protein
MTLVISPLSLIFVLLLAFGVYSLIKRIGPFQVVKLAPASYSLKSSNKISTRWIVAYLGVLAVVFIGLFLQNEIRYTLAAKKIDYIKRAELPEFSPIRLTPKPVATRYAEDSFQNPQEHLGDSQIVLDQGRLVRVSPRLPDGGLLYLVNKMNGFVTVQVDTLERKVNIYDQKFKYSEGVGVFDNIYFRLPLKRYFATYSSEPTYLRNDSGEWVTVVPYMTYKGFPFRIPEWGGVMVVSADGTINDYTPAEAESISYLKGNRIYPKELALYYADSYAYNGGILNKWFLHRNQTEIVSLPSDESVIHSATAEGFKQVIVAEPYGRSYGIFKVFVFDATTGKREIVEFDQNSQLTGPIAAADYIKREFPTYDWSGFSLSEPRPVKVAGDLNWLLSIIPNDSAGIAKTVLLNAKTNKVVGVDNEAQLQALLAGTPALPADTTAPTDKNSDIRSKIDSIQKALDELRSLVSQ